MTINSMVKNTWTGLRLGNLLGRFLVPAAGILLAVSVQPNCFGQSRSSSGRSSFSSSSPYTQRPMVLSPSIPNEGAVRVRDHFRYDGTYVPSHMRTAPDNSRLNNWSTWPNVNPYTGKTGTRRY